jgi:hypothetical protein
MTRTGVMVATMLAIFVCALPTASAFVQLRQFRSPSGNIGCVMTSGGVRCDIAHRSWKPPRRPRSCPLDYGQGITVGRTGHAGFVCAGDTALDPTGPVLAYGRSLTLSGFTCQSTTAGMTCRRASTGHGFFLSIQGYRIF